MDKKQTVERVLISIYPDMLEKLDKLAERSERSRSGFIVFLVEREWQVMKQYIGDNGKPKK